MYELGDDVMMIVRAIRVKMLKRLAAEMKATKKEAGGEGKSAESERGEWD